MPEGHTIHRLARDHTRAFGRQSVEITSPQGRFADSAALVSGTTLKRVDAHGKHLFYRFEADRVIHVHLGLFGKYWAFVPPAPAINGRQVRMRILGLTAGTDLSGPTACDLITPVEVKAITARLGPDPLRKDADPDRAWAALQRRKGPIGAALMDQGVLAGVGNVYRAEVLLTHGIHPETPCPAVSRDQFDSMWTQLVDWMRHGVKDQVIITVDPTELGKARSRIAKGEALWVYKQEHCRRCGTPVRRWDLAGRWAYACETCQPRDYLPR
jgi:endonuclease-8